MSQHWLETPSSRVRLSSPGARLRGEGMGTIVFLLIVVAALGAMVYMNSQRKEEAKVEFFNEQLTPENLLDRVVIERSRTQDLSDLAWEQLLSLMSADDLGWFQDNTVRLASFNPKLSGADAAKLPSREQSFRALEYLLQLNEGKDRQIVIRIGVDAKDKFGVAYVHSPGSIQDLKEVFLCNENGTWRIRRFMGRRDDPEVMDKLIASKTAAGAALSADEEAYKKDPKQYAEKLRDKMLIEAGLNPSANKAETPAAP